MRKNSISVFAVVGLAMVALIGWLGLAGFPATVHAAASRPAISAAGWIDVTAPLDAATMPIYPGDAPLKVDFLFHMNKGDRFTLSKLDMGVHTGTHVDAPMHFVRDGISTDKIPLATFIGPVLVIDCAPDALAVDAAELNKHQWRGAKRIFFRTRNSRNGWMTDPNFHKDFTFIAPDAAKLMADAGVVLVGIDYLSAENFGWKEPLTHRALLGKGIPIVEGLDLRAVTGGEYDLILLPMKVIGHEGIAVRAIMRKR